MKYSMTINIQLDKFLGDTFKFQGRSFTVEGCDTKEQAEEMVKDWAWDYVSHLAKGRKEQKDKTLTEEMMLEFDKQISKAQEARKKTKKEENITYAEHLEDIKK